MTLICVSKLIIIGSDNGLSPGRRQAIVWTNAGILLIGPSGTNFSEILIKLCIFSSAKIHLKMSSGKGRPFCLGLNMLTHWGRDKLATILQTAFSNQCSCVMIALFWFKCHWFFSEVADDSVWVQIMSYHRTDDKSLSEDLVHDDLLNWRIYASLGLRVLKPNISQ